MNILKLFELIHIHTNLNFQWDISAKNSEVEDIKLLGNAYMGHVLSQTEK